jgi:hypothetical protein
VTRIVSLDAARVAPDRGSVLEAQGIPREASVQDRVVRLADSAITLYERLAEPRGLWEELAPADFDEIYRGEGRNAARTPLARIYPRAARLALFAVTLGGAVSGKIRDLFDGNEPALGFALDRIASDRADAAAEMLGRRFLRSLGGKGRIEPTARVLAYSPGYCGWHITGQRALFARLRPERIGITLNASCLMQPLKSVSGLLVVADPDVHDFDADFDFCEDCSTHQCRSRIASAFSDTDEGGTAWNS